EREARRKRLGGSRPQVDLGTRRDLAELLLGGQRRRAHVGMPGERGQDVAVSPLALEDVEDLLEGDHLLHELLERRAGERRRALPAERQIPGAELDQIVLERGLVLQVLLHAGALHAIERRLGNEQVTRVDDYLVV